MPEKVRIIYKPGGTVAVIHPAPKSRREGETEAAWLNRVFTKTMAVGPLKGLPFKDVNKATLPPDRLDRDAWEATPRQGITVNAAKAAKQRADREKEVKIAAEMRAIAIKELELRGEL